MKIEHNSYAGRVTVTLDCGCHVVATDECLVDLAVEMGITDAVLFERIAAQHVHADPPRQLTVTFRRGYLVGEDHLRMTVDPGTGAALPISDAARAKIQAEMEWHTAAAGQG